MTKTTARKPVMIPVGEVSKTAKKPATKTLSEAPIDPAQAPVVPDLDLPQGAAVQTLARLTTRKRSVFARLFLWALGALFMLILSVTLWDFAASLLARNSWLGWTVWGLAGVILACLLVLALREFTALVRLRRVDHLRQETEQLLSGNATLRDAQRHLSALRRFYRNRAELRWSIGDLDTAARDTLDADALMAQAERALMQPLDTLALQEVERASRQVALVTAIVPLALADVVVALFANLRMIRRIAEIYGGRAGSIGSWRLLRSVFTHLVATGALALGDDLIGSVAGGGLLGKLSRRFGEGFINGALTARVGVAAMEVCRPMPFAAEPRPKVSALITRALGGVFSKE